MSKFKIVHRINECIGCSACAAVSPESFKMIADKAHLINSNNDNGVQVLVVEEIANNQEAANVCPVPCIFVKKVD